MTLRNVLIKNASPGSIFLQKGATLKIQNVTFDPPNYGIIFATHENQVNKIWNLWIKILNLWCIHLYNKFKITIQNAATSPKAHLIIFLACYILVAVIKVIVKHSLRVIDIFVFSRTESNIHRKLESDEVYLRCSIEDLHSISETIHRLRWAH